MVTGLIVGIILLIFGLIVFFNCNFIATHEGTSPVEICKHPIFGTPLVALGFPFIAIILILVVIFPFTNFGQIIIYGLLSGLMLIAISLLFGYTVGKIVGKIKSRKVE